MFFGRKTCEIIYGLNLILLILFLSPTPLLAQSGPDLKFEHLTPNQGLSSKYVPAMHQDSHGFMWFGTDNGLSRYDGYEFIIYRHDPDDPQSLSYSGASDDSTQSLPPGHDAAVKNVLVIYSYNKNMPSTRLIDQGIRETLSASAMLKIELYTEYMDVARFSADQYIQQLRELYQHKYSHREIDLVIVAMPPALDFILHYGDELFPNTPVVFCVVSEHSLQTRQTPENMTGILRKFNIKETLEVALQLQPATQQVIVIFDENLPSSIEMTGAVREALQEYEPRLEFRYTGNLTVEDWQAKAAHLPPQTLIFYVNLVNGAEGSVYTPQAALQRIAATSSVPIYGLFDTYLDHGIVGGYLVSYEAQGKKAADLALRILTGEKPGALPITTDGTNVYMFDWQQLKRYDLAKARLPAGSIIINRPPSLWDLYKGWIITGGIVITTESLLLVTLLVQSRIRRQAEKELQQYREHLEVLVDERTLSLKQEIAERRRAEAALRESEAKYRGLVEGMNEAIFRMALPEGRYEYVGPAAQSVLGHSPEDFYAQPLLIQHTIHPDFRAYFEEKWAELQAGYVAPTYEYKVVDAEGQTRWIMQSNVGVRDAEGRLIALEGICRDVTAAKHAEMALRESEERFATVMDSIEALIYVADMDTYELLFVNEYTREMMDIAPGQLCWQALQKNQSGPCPFCTNEHLVADGKSTGTYTWEFQNTRTGRWHHIQDQAIRWPDGRLVRLEVATDITEQKRAEQQRRKQQQQVAAFEEREHIGRELHDDFGQTMSIINVQAQAMQSLLAQGQHAPTQVSLDKIIHLAQEAQVSIRHYILGLRERDPVSNTGSFASALREYIHQAQTFYNLSVSLNLPEGFTELLLTEEVRIQLLRILQEAVTNVRKHAGVDQAQIYIFPEPEYIQVVVEDKGCGFDAPSAVAASPSIQHPASSNEYPASSTHFGLSIMRERAEKVGGTLSIHTAPGEGTRVVVRVPRAIVSRQEAIASSTLRVLLVDDHPMFLDGLRALLVARGIHVVGTAHDGLQAQAQARALHPDVILMDVQMPGCDGVEATRLIKSEFPEVRIVMLSVAADDETLFAALKAGASGYLLKNLDGDDFYTLLRNFANGEVVLAPPMAQRVLAEFTQAESVQAAQPVALEAEEQPPAVLSPEERQTLTLVAQGLTYREVAAKVHYSERTIKYRMAAILEKLHFNNRAEAIAYAYEKGWATLE